MRPSLLLITMIFSSSAYSNNCQDGCNTHELKTLNEEIVFSLADICQNTSSYSLECREDCSSRETRFRQYATKRIKLLELSADIISQFTIRVHDAEATRVNDEQDSRLNKFENPSVDFQLVLKKTVGSVPVVGRFIESVIDLAEKASKSGKKKSLSGSDSLSYINQIVSDARHEIIAEKDQLEKVFELWKQRKDLDNFSGMGTDDKDNKILKKLMCNVSPPSNHPLSDSYGSTICTSGEIGTIDCREINKMNDLLKKDSNQVSNIEREIRGYLGGVYAKLNIIHSDGKIGPARLTLKLTAGNTPDSIGGIPNSLLGNAWGFDGFGGKQLLCEIVQKDSLRAKGSPKDILLNSKGELGLPMQITVNSDECALKIVLEYNEKHELQSWHHIYKNSKYSTDKAEKELFYDKIKGCKWRPKKFAEQLVKNFEKNKIGDLVPLKKISAKMNGKDSCK